MPSEPFALQNPDWATPVRESFHRQGMMTTLGVELHRIERGEVRLRCRHQASLTQHHGYLHAGVLGTLLDSSCGWAAQTLMPPGSEVLTVEYKLNLLRPAVGELFESCGKVVRAGRTISAAEGSLYAVDDPERMIATLTATLIAVGHTTSTPTSASDSQ